MPDTESLTPGEYVESKRHALNRVVNNAYNHPQRNLIATAIAGTSAGVAILGALIGGADKAGETFGNSSNRLNTTGAEINNYSGFAEVSSAIGMNETINIDNLLSMYGNQEDFSQHINWNSGDRQLKRYGISFDISDLETIEINFERDEDGSISLSVASSLTGDEIDIDSIRRAIRQQTTSLKIREFSHKFHEVNDRENCRAEITQEVDLSNPLEIVITQDAVVYWQGSLREEAYQMPGKSTTTVLTNRDPIMVNSDPIQLSADGEYAHEASVIQMCRFDDGQLDFVDVYYSVAENNPGQAASGNGGINGREG